MTTVLQNPPTQSIDQVQPKKELMLNGYAAIQYYKGVGKKHAWCTEEIQLIFIQQGDLTLQIGNENYSIRPQQLIFLKKDIWVESLNSPTMGDNLLEYIQFTIRPDLIREFAKLHPHPPVRPEDPFSVIVKEGAPSWRTYIRSLDPYLINNCCTENGLIKLKMLELLFQLSSMDKCLCEHLLAVRERSRPNITATVEDNIMTSFSMGQLAEMSGRSLSSFRRDFLAIYNMPPSQWIRLKRLEKAKELLRSTTMTITDICYTLGFENIAHFSRLFKSQFGIPPSDYKLKLLVA